MGLCQLWRRSDSYRDFSVHLFCRVAQHFFQNAVDDEVGIAADGRGEMRVGWRRQREVAAIFLGVARLLQRAQHQVRQNAFLRLAGDFLGKLLIHARRDVNFFGNFDVSGVLAGAVRASRRSALNCTRLTGKRSDAERVAELRGDDFEVVDALGIGLFVDAVERGDAFVLEVAATHSLAESMNSSMMRLAMLRSERVMLFIRPNSSNSMTGSGKIEVDGAATLALAVQDHRQVAHQLEEIDQRCSSGCKPRRRLRGSALTSV